MNKLPFVFLFFYNFTFSQVNNFIIPKPTYQKNEKSIFHLSSNTSILYSDELKFESSFLIKTIHQQTGISLKNNLENNNKIILIVDTTSKIEKEAYELKIESNQISIKSSHAHGVFYGIQTLIQMLPLQKSETILLTNTTINDKPKFKWRGMHLDVSRHYFTPVEVKKYLDLLAFYKLNTFHWHLTDDQGWRIEIKKYPKLTDIGSKRKGTMVGHYNAQKIDSIAYGSYYSQNDIKEIVEYAKERHITIVPEIEMPGHALAAIAAYPQLSCTGEKLEVGTKWGVFDDVFCPYDSTFIFLENVLDEVISLFPSEYIHIGGDECPKIRWKSSNYCQKLIEKNKLKDEHGLQSYFIQRIEKFVNGKGRKIIGWDEILEGGLAPNAAVMSWQGTSGGIAAAKQKHDVVMSPGSHCYFDHYQGNPEYEPLAIGGHTTYKKVYSFDPIPKELTKDEEKYILGAQGNVWTEYMKTFKHVEYMVLPRIAALSEVVWGTSNPAELKNFESRLLHHFNFYEYYNYNYSKAIFELSTKVSANNTRDGVLFNLQSVEPEIKYTIDGTDPDKNSKVYVSPLNVKNSQTIKAAYFKNGNQKSAILEQKFFVSKSTGKSIQLKNLPHENYATDGPSTLVNGIKGNPEKYGNNWLGFSGKDLEATIDLGKPTDINSVALNFLKSEGSWIYFPTQVEIWYSNDNKNFVDSKNITRDEVYANNGVLVINNLNINSRFIKVIAKNNGIIQEGKPGAGSKSWLFVDEIEIH